MSSELLKYAPTVERAALDENSPEASSTGTFSSLRSIDLEPRRDRRIRDTSVRIFLTCFIVFGLHFATNTVREIYPALSLADHMSFDVSEYQGLHSDIFEMQGRGSFINNNPGASMMGAVPYVLLKPAVDRVVNRVQTARSVESNSQDPAYNSIYPMAQEFYKNARAKGFDVKFGLAAAIMQVLVMAPLSALSAVVMFWLLLAVTKNRRASVLLALLFAFATPVFYRTAQLNQNLLLADFALFSFALLWRPWAEEESRPSYLFAGLCAGWTVVLDYSGIVALAALSGYALARWMSYPTEKRTAGDLAKFAGGVAACGLVLMAYQWSSFGNPILPAQSYMPPANFTDAGYRGFSLPAADLLFDTAFSMRFGLFTSAPLLLLALYAPAWLSKRTRLLERRETIFVVGITVLFFIFCSANQYGRMQFNTGVRHIVPVAPFVFLLAATTLLRLPRIGAVLFAVLATYWSWCLVMYRDVEQGLGIPEAIKHVTLEGFRLPWLTTLENMGYVQHATALPLMLLCGVVIWIIWKIDGERRFTGA